MPLAGSEWRHLHQAEFLDEQLVLINIFYQPTIKKVCRDPWRTTALSSREDKRKLDGPDFQPIRNLVILFPTGAAWSYVAQLPPSDVGDGEGGLSHYSSLSSVFLTVRLLHVILSPSLAEYRGPPSPTLTGLHNDHPCRGGLIQS